MVMIGIVILITMRVKEGCSEQEEDGSSFPTHLSASLHEDTPMQGCIPEFNLLFAARKT